jgi:hypothetical protein
MDTQSAITRNRRYYAIAGGSGFFLGLILMMFGFATIGQTLLCIGDLLAIVACYYWAVFKGRSRFFCLLGLANVSGFLILAFMEDKS